MCTLYSLKDDDPHIFRRFIPRNLSYSESLENIAENPSLDWRLLPNLVVDCDCEVPKSVHAGRKTEFLDGSNGTRKSSIKAADCFLCHGTPTYCPSEFELTVPSTTFRSRSASNYRTRSKKKSVRFADAMGLQLSTVKVISKTERAPVLNSSAVKDLHLEYNLHLAVQGIKYFSPCFSLPTETDVLRQKALDQNICLEAANIQGMVLLGTIMVRNLFFEKLVGIRISFNGWSSFKDNYGSYILDSSDGAIDRFSFSVVIPKSVVVGSTIQFSVFYLAQDGTTFWDNNSNQNYVFECFAKNMGLVNDDGWLHFL